MFRIVILGLLLSFVTCFTHVLGQGGKESYRQAYDQLVRMLDGKDSLSFKKAVFITENAYFDNTLSYDKFNAQITAFSAICRQIGDQGKFTDVKNNLPYNWSIYKFITDTLPFTFQGDTITKLPYRYDTLDPTGEKDITNTFVLKLISTGTGNCRSLPYLYKILADELKAEAGFALAPYHIYIKHYDAPNRYNERRVYNVELTNGSFPRDGWIVASSYITWTSIKRGMFGVRLDDKKTIALCLGDLAVSYERKFGTDDFLIKLYHTALKYHPVNAQNRLRLAETYRKKGNISLADSICKALVFDGYREMPDQMYNMWVSEIRRDKDALHSDTSRTYEAPKDIFGNPMPTLSKGKFKEDVDLTDSTRVGSVVVDCETGKVIRYLKEKRVYDVSRFLSVDPLAPSYPYYTPYQFAGNTPITAIDIDGLEPDKNLNKNETGYANGPDRKTGEDKNWKWDGENWVEHWHNSAVIEGKKDPVSMEQIGKKEGMGFELTSEEKDFKDRRTTANPYSPPTIEAFSISVGYGIFCPTGGTQSINLVAMAGKGIDISHTGGVGSGLDAGNLGISMTFSSFVGNTKDYGFDSYNGKGVTAGVGYGPFSVGSSFDLADNEEIGGNWRGLSLGFGKSYPLGGKNNPALKVPISGAVQVTYTTSLSSMGKPVLNTFKEYSKKTRDLVNQALTLPNPY